MILIIEQQYRISQIMSTNLIQRSQICKILLHFYELSKTFYDFLMIHHIHNIHNFSGLPQTFSGDLA